MLKIKDNVDLKVLESDFEFSQAGDFYYHFFDEFNEIIIDQPTRIIEIDGCVERTSLNKYNDILFALISAGLVEKVGE